ncbi:uncharacterized protein DEA37_0005852 [Paragonimus westermani]|uniref:Mediator of RNA polymerase II transcription subunit 21 n=1 Tax=Paragonimus westermani TaxID=34504 RepID=A0A5J4NMX7_9TREM|nr:uncharacterized protein DEA37_0005852 [Paragonimus westermani]
MWFDYRNYPNYLTDVVFVLFSCMADRLTELQDAINLQAENLCNAIGVIQQVAQPSFFSDFNWASRAAKPEYQAFLQGQPPDDIGRNFAVVIAATARQLDALIGSLPEEEASTELQRSAVQRLIEDYRAEGWKLARVTARLDSRLTEVRRFLTAIAQTQLTTQSLESEVLMHHTPVDTSTENSMEIDNMATDDVHQQTDFLDHSPSENWISNLLIVFFVILGFRVAHALNIVNRLHNFFLYLGAISTAAGRQRRATRLRLAAELMEMRVELKKLNMVNNFARYSRTERQIKSLARQIAQLSQDTVEKSLFRTVGIRASLFLLESLLTGWLIARSPSRTVSGFMIEDAHLRGSYFVPVLYVLQYIPAKLAMMFWVGFCHYAIKPLTSWCQQLSANSRQPSLVDPLIDTQTEIID